MHDYLLWKVKITAWEQNTEEGFTHLPILTARCFFSFFPQAIVVLLG